MFFLMTTSKGYRIDQLQEISAICRPAGRIEIVKSK